MRQSAAVNQRGCHERAFESAGLLEPDCPPRRVFVQLAAALENSHIHVIAPIRATFRRVMGGRELTNGRRQFEEIGWLRRHAEFEASLRRDRVLSVKITQYSGF